MTSKNIDETSFPLYAIQALNANLLVTCGGGGAAKTGVRNAIHVYKLIEDGLSFKSECLCELDTGDGAPMNMDVNPSRDVLAVGMDHFCQLYEIKYKKDRDKEEMVLKATESIPTVKAATSPDADDGEYQKCVKFSPDGNFLITGGSDGSCKIFKYPSLEIAFTIKKAHDEELDEISVHPNSKFFATVSRDSCAGIWRTSDGLKETELSFCVDKKDEDFYRFRNCLFSENMDNNTTYLYTTQIPRRYTKDKSMNCLVKWCTKSWVPEKTVFIKKNTLSSLSASDSGRYVAVGTAEGSILVYISWNMMPLHAVDGIHDVFVTGMSFIPENKRLCEDMGQDAAILSCSIDNKCQVTLIPSRRQYSLTVFLIIFFFVIVAVFNMITYLDLDF